METKIQKYISDFFVLFEDCSITTKDILTDCQKCAYSILILLQRYKRIQRANLFDAPLAVYTNLKEKLNDKILELVDKEIQTIKDKQFQLENLHAKLEKKFSNLTSSCSEIDFSADTKLVKGSSLQPRLAVLLELANDSLQYLAQICTQIDLALELVTICTFDIGNSFSQSFIIDKVWSERLTEILSLTQYCSTVEI